jgi:hypothetical protein
MAINRFQDHPWKNMFYTVVQYYENGVYDKEEAIKQLKVEALFNQILFHTEKSFIAARKNS